MFDVFLSYAREDRERARTIAFALETQGWSVWWDRKIVAGESFDRTIEEQLESARAVVVLWSIHSIDSEWVRNEAAAASERKALVPALIDDVKQPLEFRRRHAANLTAWSGDPADPEFLVLHQGLKAKCSLRREAPGRAEGPTRTVPTAPSTAKIVAPSPGRPSNAESVQRSGSAMTVAAWSRRNVIVAAGIAVAIVTRFFGLPLFSPSLLIKRAAEGFVFAISGSTTVVYNDVDKVVLAHYGMDRANGIYSMAYRVVNIGAMPIQSIVGAALPRFFREGVNGIAAFLVSLAPRILGGCPSRARSGAE